MIRIYLQIQLLKHLNFKYEATIIQEELDRILEKYKRKAFDSVVLYKYVKEELDSFIKIVEILKKYLHSEYIQTGDNYNIKEDSGRIIGELITNHIYLNDISQIQVLNAMWHKVMHTKYDGSTELHVRWRKLLAHLGGW